MQPRINDLLEALWSDIKHGLNDDQEGMDLIKLEELLRQHSRHILAELGKNNIQALPPSVVENIFRYILPQGIDPLIESVLSYLKVDRVQEVIYLDPLDTIRQATQNLRMILEGISENELSVENLAWLQYQTYQSAITAWQDVLQRTYAKVKLKLMQNQVYCLIRQELEKQHGKINRWENYVEDIKKRKADLIKLRETFENSSNDLPASFFSTPAEKWKQLMLLSPEAESYWLKLWNKRENAGLTPTLLSTYFYQPLQTSKKILAASLNFVGVTKGTGYLKTDKQAVAEMMDQRILSYQETVDSCQTLIAINKAKDLIISKETMLSAQIQQLTQLEVYLTGVMSALTHYADNRQQLDNNGTTFFLKVKAWLGFKKAIEECASTDNLAATKAQSFTKVANSTLNILNAVKTAKILPSPSWSDLRFQKIKKHIDTLHTTIHEERLNLSLTFDTHNEKFRNEWYFWQRKTMLTGLFESISQYCPVGPRIR